MIFFSVYPEILTFESASEQSAMTLKYKRYAVHKNNIIYFFG